MQLRIQLRGAVGGPLSRKFGKFCEQLIVLREVKNWFISASLYLRNFYSKDFCLLTL